MLLASSVESNIEPSLVFLTLLDFQSDHVNDDEELFGLAFEE
jgi:hypothetical protein